MKKLIIILFSAFLFFSFALAESASCKLDVRSAYRTAGDPSVYYITSECTKRPFNNPTVFFTYFGSWSEVRITSGPVLNSIPDDGLGFMPWGPLYNPKYGALVKTVYDPKVYLLLGNTKYWITSEEIFNALNYFWNWIEDVDEELLNKYIVGSEINYTDHHPNYTIVKYADSNKVYRLEPDPDDAGKQVKKHIKNEQEFVELGFRWDRIVTIPESEQYTEDFSPIGDAIPTPVWTGEKHPTCGDGVCGQFEELHCPHDCLASTGDYMLEDGRLAVFVPKGYEPLAEPHLQDLKNCFPLIKNLWDITPYYDFIFLKLYFPKPGEPNLSYGGEAGVRYRKKQENMDRALADYVNSNPAGFLYYSGPVYCSNAHELAHVFTYHLRNGLTSWANEGIAEYTQKNIQGNVKSNIECRDNGVYRPDVWGAGGKKLFPYAKLGAPIIQGDPASSAIRYSTGMCFWEFIDETYGRDKLQEIIDRLESVSDIDYVYTSGLLNKEIFIEQALKPVLGDDIEQIIESRFGIEEDENYN